MKRAAYLLLCLLAAAGGLVAGWHLREEEPATEASAKPRATVEARDVPAVKSLPPLKGYARLRQHTLSSASGDTAALPSLLKSCDGDPAALYILMDAWMAKNPAAFLRAFSESLMRGDLSAEGATEMFSAAVKLLIEQGHDTALSVAKEMPVASRSWVLAPVMKALSDANPEAAIKLGIQNPTIAPAASLKLKGRRDLLPLIRQLRPSVERGNMLAYALDGALLSEAIQEFSRSSDYVQVNSFSRHLRNSEFPADELMTAHEAANGPWKIKLAEAAAESLIKEDPAAAVTWIDDHLSGSRRNQFLKKLAGDQSEPEVAAAAQAMLPEKPAQEADAKE